MTREKMSRGARTTQDAKRYVIRRAVEDPKTDRTELAKKIRQELFAKRIIPPAISTLKSMISTARNRKSSPEDQPWHMGTFKVYAPSAGGLVAIWKSYRFVIDQRARLDKEDPILKLATIESDAMLTLREVKWIARLDPVVRMIYTGLDEEVLVPSVISWALSYAEDEILSEVMGTPFNPQTLDGNLARAAAISIHDESDVSRYETRVFGSLLRTRRNKLEMKESLTNPFERERAELITESKKKKLGDREYWRQYGERLNSISMRELAQDLRDIREKIPESYEEFKEIAEKVSPEIYKLLEESGFFDDDPRQKKSKKGAK